MKFQGTILTPPPNQFIVIPRETGDLTFELKMVSDFVPFETIYPLPEPIMKTVPGKAPVPMLDHPDYRKAVAARSAARYNWMLLQSLSATKDLEFETVKMDDPSTYNNLHTEMQAAGFSGAEINAIFDKIFDVNGLNQEKIEKATQLFLAGRQVR